jgi:hypothetical protein
MIYYKFAFETTNFLRPCIEHLFVYNSDHLQRLLWFIFYLITLYRDIKNYLGQRWSWIGKRPSNLFRVRFLRYERLAYQHLFFMSHRTSFAKHTDTICKACIKIFRHAKCGKKWNWFWHSKNDWHKCLCVIYWHLSKINT